MPGSSLQQRNMAFDPIPQATNPCCNNLVANIVGVVPSRGETMRRRDFYESNRKTSRRVAAPCTHWSRDTRKVLSIAFAIFVASIVTAVAETYPSRPITIVVPFPAGGPTDALGRVLADRMTRALNQSVIVENVTGAAGTIGAAHVAHSAPDGYTTILGHWQTHVVNGATFTLSFDVVNDFEPISLIADCPNGWLDEILCQRRI